MPSFLTKLVRNLTKPAQRKSSARRHRPTLGVEQLERRALMTHAAIQFVPVVSDFNTNTGELRITGNNWGNNIRIDEQVFGLGASYLVVSGVDYATFNGGAGSNWIPSALVRSIRIDTGAGDDVVSIARTGWYYDNALGRVAFNHWYGYLIPITISTGMDADTVNLSGSNDSPTTIFGGAGNDTITGGPGSDAIRGEAGRDYLTGGGGNDQLGAYLVGSVWTDDAESDVMSGGWGNDTIAGGWGNDTLNGDDGHDFIWGDYDHDKLSGGTGNDMLDGGQGSDSLYGWTGDDTLNGGTGHDSLYGEQNNDTLNGWTGNDLLEGGADQDYLYGYTGNDILNGGSGHDSLYGEDNNDTLNGQLGNDLLDGGQGIDNLYGWYGNDTLNGGTEDDFLYGEQDHDILNGWTGNDTLEGGEGSDSLFGWTGNDTLKGGDDDDFLYGQQDNDTLYGGGGRDRLEGGTHNDGLFGGAFADVDTLIGGSGADRFLVIRFEDSASDNVSGEDARLYFSAGDKLWTNNEIEQLDKGFAWLHTLTNNTQLLKMWNGAEIDFQRVVFLPDALADNDDRGLIRVTDRAFDPLMDPPDQTIVHELAHNWENESSYWGAWLNESGWEPWWTVVNGTGKELSKDGLWYYRSDATFAKGSKDYSRTDPYEDWCMSWEVYYMYKQNPTDAAEAEYLRLYSKMALLDQFVASIYG